MTAKPVNGSGNGARSGAQTLILLAMPLNVSILWALSDGPKQQPELRREAGAPAQSTLRAQLKRLAAAEVIEKQRRDRFPGVLEYELTSSGRDLLFVVETLERWLGDAPEGSLALGDGAARAAVKALAEGWSTAMVRALAANPLTLTELSGVIASLSYPSLQRRLNSMRLAGQLEALAGDGRGTPYAVTTWLRQSLAPLAAAARWERRHRQAETAPLGRLDVEAAFLLAVPLLRLPQGLTGTCRMAAEIPDGKQRRLAGILVRVRDGEIAGCATALQGNCDAWALGSPAAWLDAVVEHDRGPLELGGDCSLASSLIDGMHKALFVAHPAIHP